MSPHSPEAYQLLIMKQCLNLCYENADDLEMLSGVQQSADLKSSIPSKIFMKIGQSFKS